MKYACKPALILFFFLISSSAFSQDYIEHVNEIYFGNENLAKTKTLNGGNYVMAGYNLQLLDQLALGAKLSADIVPRTFDDVLASAQLRINSKISKNRIQKSLGIFYMRNFSSQPVRKDFLGARIALINYITDSKKGVEFLPITIFYDIGSGFSLGYEFITFSILF
ncbi:MAG: hypothetical protein JXR03_08185 [Cyclobacteriaceae bacterium]